MRHPLIRKSVPIQAIRYFRSYKSPRYLTGHCMVFDTQLQNIPGRVLFLSSHLTEPESTRLLVTSKVGLGIEQQSIAYAETARQNM